MMTDEDRMAIIEIVRIEVRMAVKHLFDVLEHNDMLKRGASFCVVGCDPPTKAYIDDNWVHKSPRP